MNSVTQARTGEIRIGSVTALELLLDCLRAARVGRVYGLEPGIDPALLPLLADATGRLGGGPGAALLEGQVLRLSTRPGGEAEPVVVGTPAEIPLAVARAAVQVGGDVPETALLQLNVDLDGPAPDGVRPTGLAMA